MNVLLDTHAFLWFIEGSPRLSDGARELIRDPATELFMSVASLWEIAVKASIGRLPLLQPFEILIPDQLAHHEISVIPIEISHLVEMMRLERHHGDPFDRLLIAQAIVERLPIVGADPVFDDYPGSRLW
jgi:PIN domain nuclease of toxin-antitoxin system